MKTIAEIKAEHSAKAGTIMTRYQDEIQQIRATKKPAESAYLDRLSDGQRFQLLREEKAQKAAEAHERTLREYTREVERYQAALSERTNTLKPRLFGVEDAGALSRAALADETELSTLLDVATQAGNGDLARAVFVAAHHKGAGDLLARYFDGIDPEARGLYGELTDAPSPELLERQRDSVERVVQMPDPDSLTPSPAFGPY